MQRLVDMSTSELIQFAAQHSASIKEVGIYSELMKELTTRLGANTAAVTQALKERDETRFELSSAQLTISQITKVMGTSDTLSISEQVSDLNKQVVNLAVENASLLPKAASELSNAWMLHKYWVGIQVALMHVNAGRLHDGMTWLQNTVSGPGIEAPQLSDFAEIEAWANEQQKDSIGHVRALEIIKAASPATETAIANIKVQARIDGAHFVANRMLAAWEAGFIEDSAKNAADIARMILTSTEFMPTAPEGDFDRSFADGVLVDISAQLRKEAGNA